MSKSEAHDRKRKQTHNQVPTQPQTYTQTSTDTSTSTSASTSPHSSSNSIEIPSSSSFRETVHALISHYLPPVLSNIIMYELLENQWDGWMPIHGVSCDLFLPFTSDSSLSSAISDHGQRYDVELSSLISPDVSHIRYHLLSNSTKTNISSAVVRPFDYEVWGGGKDEYDSHAHVNEQGNITWNYVAQQTHAHPPTAHDDDNEIPVKISKRRRRSIASTPHQRRKPQQQQKRQQQQEEYETKRDLIMNEMSDEARSIVLRLFGSSPYEWSHFRKSLPTTATLAHILSRPWSAWRKVDSNIYDDDDDDEKNVEPCFELISPHEWIRIICLNDSKQAGKHGIRLEYRPRNEPECYFAYHVLPPGSKSLPCEHFQLCVRLM